MTILPGKWPKRRQLKRTPLYTEDGYRIILVCGHEFISKSKPRSSGQRWGCAQCCIEGKDD